MGRWYFQKLIGMKNLLKTTVAILLFMAVNNLFAQPRSPQGIRLGMGRSEGGDPDTAWISPDKTAPDIATYELYPTPARGKGTQGSFLIYLPNGYKTNTSKRYPVIYFLHEGNGNQSSAIWLMEKMDKAIFDGKMPPVIVVGLQALPIGWYVNANIGVQGVVSGPVEDVIIQNLVPYVDLNYRTITNANGRGLEGWSMGGFGATRLAFKYPELFGFASSLSGALINFKDERNPQYLENTFGPSTGTEAAKSEAFFNSVHPRVYASANAEKIKNHVAVRFLVGDQDWLYNNQGNYITKNFSDYLDSLGIKHEYTVIKGVGHMLPDAFDKGEAVYPIDFWVNAFGK